MLISDLNKFNHEEHRRKIMSDNSNEQKTAKVVATAKLTENQVQQALVEFVSKDEKLVDLLKEKEAVAWVNWHVNKWDDPESFCTLSFGVADTSSGEPTEPKNEL
jgi:hypothetical protein